MRDEVVEHCRGLRRRGLRTGLLTNNAAEFAAFWRPLLPLEELFDDVVDSCEVGVRKPDPRIYEHTLAELGGITPGRAVFLDDYPGNIVAAEAVGMIGVLVEADPAEAIARVDELLAG